VEQERGQNAHHQHEGQRLEREDELRTGRGQLEREWTAADVAEDEGGAGEGGCADCVDRALEGGEGELDLRNLEQTHCGGDGHQQRDRDASPLDRAPVLADRPSEAEQGEDAQRRLQLKHFAVPPVASHGSLFENAR